MHQSHHLLGCHATGITSSFNSFLSALHFSNLVCLIKKAALTREKIKRNMLYKKAVLTREKIKRNMFDKKAVLTREKIKRNMLDKKAFLDSY